MNTPMNTPKNRQSSSEPTAGSDGNYMTKQHLSVLRQLAEQIDLAVPAGQLLPDWAESKVGVAAAALKDVAGWLMAEKDPARRTAASTVTVRVKGRPEQYTGDPNAIRAALRAEGIPSDRVSVVVPAFADSITLLPREANILIRGRVVQLVPGTRPPAPPRERDLGAAERLYFRLLNRLGREARDGARDYQADNPEADLEGVVYDLAEGVYQLHKEELEPLMLALGYRPRRVIDALAEMALG